MRSIFSLFVLQSLCIGSSGYLTSSLPRREHQTSRRHHVKLVNSAADSRGHTRGLDAVNPWEANVSSRLRGPVSADGEHRPSVEMGMRYRQDEWLFNLFSLPGSFILRRIWHHLAINAVISLAAAASYQRWGAPSIPMLGHTLMGGFLSLLLVFRQNTAYSRFYEARGIWSSTMATCRNLATDVVCYIRPKAPVAAKKMLTLIAAFPDALAHTCKSGDYPLAHNVKKIVIPRSGKSKLSPATVLCIMMQETLHAVPEESDSFQKVPMDYLHLYTTAHDIHSLTSSLTSCEKIVKTPVPWSYSKHASRFLTIWSGTLPFAVVSTLGWLTVPVVTALCWCLFGIEEIGHLIEQPFVGYRKSMRARLTQPYDVGIPVFVLSNQARLEVEGIAALQPSH